MFDETSLQAFLDFPLKIYPEPVTNRETEEDILRGVNPICRYVTVTPHLVRRAGEVVGRCAVSLPTSQWSDGVATLGFYESIDDVDVAAELFDWARAQAREAGYDHLIGPVDASFWIRYRMKLDEFDDPYYPEPLNPPYYPRLWEETGWQITGRYSSNVFGVVPPGFGGKNLDQRLAAALAAGYRMETLSMADWDRVMEKVYALIMDRFSEMTLFHRLEWADFQALFSPLRHLIDPEIVTLVWQGEELAGLSLCLPDYGTLLNNPTSILTKARILKRKRHYKRGISLYLASTQPGLGTAMAGMMLIQGRDRGITAVGALIAEGKPNESYATDIITSRRHYALWTLPL